MNIIIGQLKFEFTHYNVIVQYISHWTMATQPPSILLLSYITVMDEFLEWQLLSKKYSTANFKSWSWVKRKTYPCQTFELGSEIPFPTMITIMQAMPYITCSPPESIWQKKKKKKKKKILPRNNIIFYNLKKKKKKKKKKKNFCLLWVTSIVCLWILNENIDIFNKSYPWYSAMISTIKEDL